MARLRFVEYSDGRHVLQFRRRDFIDWADVEIVEARKAGPEPLIAVPEENEIWHGPSPNSDPGNTRPGQFSDFTARLSHGVTSDPEFTDKPLKIFPPLVSADRELINAMKGRIEDLKDHMINLQTEIARLDLENRRLTAKLSLATADRLAEATRRTCGGSGKGGTDA